MLKLKLLSTEAQFMIAEHFFNQIKQWFPVFKEFKYLIDGASGHVYTGNYNGDFQGVLFLHRWNLPAREVFIGGYSKRHSPHTIEGLKLLTQATFEDYPVVTIYSETHKDNKPAQLCLRRAGYRFIKEYDDKKLFIIERA